MSDNMQVRHISAKSSRTARSGKDTSSREDAISLLDLLLVLVKHRKFIIVFTILSAVGIVLFSLYTLFMPQDSVFNPLPNVYRPRVEVLLQDSPGGLGSKVGGELSLLAGLASMGNTGMSSAELAMWLLRGNTIVDQIADEFGIVEKYNITEYPQTAARKILLENLSSEFNEMTGILSISYEDIDPEFATTIVNRFLELLEFRFKSLTKETVTTKREFLEARLAEAESDLRTAQTSIIEFQKKYGIIDISAQADFMIKQVAGIRSSIISKELELQNLLQYLRTNDPQVVRIQNEIKVYKQLLNEMQGGFDEFSGESIPQNEIPEISAKFMNLKRDLTVQETIYSMLRQQYETTKIDENDNSRKFQIVERAVLPEKKAGPSRGMICILFTIGMFMLGIMIAFVREYFSRAKEDPEEAEKLSAIRSMLGKKPTT